MTTTRNAILALAATLFFGLVLAQDGDGGLPVGEAGGDAQQEIQELRDLHDRMGEILDALEARGTATADADASELRMRVERLERQVRRSAAREAQNRIEGIRTEFEADGDAEELVQRLERTRGDLAQAFGAEGEEGELDEAALGRELTTNFDSLADMLQAGEDPSGTFDELGTGLERLAQEGRPAGDEEAPEDDVETDDAAEDAEGDAVDPQILGAQIYAENCAACHQGQGEGIEGVYPPLAGNPFVTGDPEPVLATVIHGRGGMPSFASLSDREIAAVVSHERTSWGNDADPVDAEMASNVREGGDYGGTPTTEPGEGGPNYRPGAAN